MAAGLDNVKDNEPAKEQDPADNPPESPEQKEKRLEFAKADLAPPVSTS